MSFYDCFQKRKLPVLDIITWFGLCLQRQKQYDLQEKMKGKIRHTSLGTIHVILKKTLPYFLNQILQMRLPVIHDVVGCRHGNLQ